MVTDERIPFQNLASMTHPEMSPLPAGPRRELGARHISGDDIELPSLSASAASVEPSVERQDGDEILVSSKRAVTGRLAQLLLAAGLVSALAVGGWFWQRGYSSESANPNWRLAVAAKNASVAQGATVVSHRASTVSTQLLKNVELSLGDSNPNLTLAVQSLLARNDLASANATVQSAVGANSMTASPKSGRQATPELRPNTRIVTAIRDGSAQFFQLRLFDCCAEDGDVVDLSINGEHYARVPLTHDGTVITMPLTPGATVISLKGVHDGGGGITVSFQSSQGDYFCQPLAEGEEFQVGVVIR
ncbi:MAG TPA: hypothetical protein VGI40_16220 [Pirellulaceae bacterium]|jgi:hypothetical protein